MMLLLSPQDINRICVDLSKYLYVEVKITINGGTPKLAGWFIREKFMKIDDD